MNEQLQMLLGAKFTLLGSKLTAAFKKETSGYTILVAPTETEKNEGVTIQEMVNQVNQLVNGVDSTAPQIAAADVEQKIQATNNQPAGGQFDIKKLRIILDMAYLYITSDGTNKTIEYAFSLTIDTTDVIPQDIKFLNIENITIAIWNTNRSKIINKMALFDPKSYIAG